MHRGCLRHILRIKLQAAHGCTVVQTLIVSDSDWFTASTSHVHVHPRFSAPVLLHRALSSSRRFNTSCLPCLRSSDVGCALWSPTEGQVGRGSRTQCALYSAVQERQATAVVCPTASLCFKVPVAATFTIRIAAPVLAHVTVLSVGGSRTMLPKRWVQIAPFSVRQLWTGICA